MTAREAGVLLHPTSLPGRFGVGDLGPAADRFLSWAAEAGQGVWQVLPLGPTGYDASPYGCLSAFAGNPVLISPEKLLEEGFLPRGTLDSAPRLEEGGVDSGRAAAWKEEILRASWAGLGRVAPPDARRDLERFREAPEHAPWLGDWGLYSALKASRGGREWSTWDRDLVRRHPAALAAARRELSAEIDYQIYLQFLFFRQWEGVKRFAARLGIRLLGDVPFYMARDSADVWSNPSLFRLTAAGLPEVVAGVPPDYFSATGQLWGNPIYRWDAMEASGFAWWIARVRANLRLADLLRLDHFRGFSAYWEVPALEETAARGRWVPGPGKTLFDAMHGALGPLPLIAEDLGHITPDVDSLRSVLGIPGTKVLQFAFGEPNSAHLPASIAPDMVVYTGTHDNDTTRGWFRSLGAEERLRVLQFFESDGTEIEWNLIRAAYASRAGLAIVPVQDILGLGSEARMNTPGESSGNWGWRLREGQLSGELAARLEALCHETGRDTTARDGPASSR